MCLDVLSIICDVSSIIFYLTIDISDLSFYISLITVEGLTYFAFQFIHVALALILIFLVCIFNSNLVVADKFTVFKSNCASYLISFVLWSTRLVKPSKSPLVPSTFTFTGLVIAVVLAIYFKICFIDTFTIHLR